MADYDLIDAYLGELAVAVRWHRHRADIVAETDDHLRCAIEQRIDDGVDPEAAQRDVLERFGDPAVVARAFAMTHSPQLALPSRSTRDAGVLAYLSAGLWIALPAVWFVGGWFYDRVDDGTTVADEVGGNLQLLLIGGMAMTLLGAAATLLSTTLILRERHGGFGPVGMAGVVAIGLGCMASLVGWFFAGWGSLLIAGTALVAADLWHRRIAPRPPILASGTGLAVGGVIWTVLRIGEVGGADQHGDYPVANAAGLVVGSVILAGGLIGIGRWLRNEKPVEPAGPTAPVAG